MRDMILSISKLFIVEYQLVQRLSALFGRKYFTMSLLAILTVIYRAKSSDHRRNNPIVFQVIEKSYFQNFPGTEHCSQCSVFHFFGIYHHPSTFYSRLGFLWMAMDGAGLSSETGL